MKQLFLSPVFVGGVIPCILLGLYGTGYKILSDKISATTFMLGVGVSTTIAMIALALIMQEKVVWQEVKTPLFGAAMGVGLFWTAALLCNGIGMGVLKGPASILMPILNANAVIIVFLAIVVLKEPVVIWKVLLGTALVIAGSVVLTTAGKA